MVRGFEIKGHYVKRKTTVTDGVSEWVTTPHQSHADVHVETTPTCESAPWALPSSQSRCAARAPRPLGEPDSPGRHGISHIPVWKPTPSLHLGPLNRLLSAAGEVSLGSGIREGGPGLDLGWEDGSHEPQQPGSLRRLCARANLRV